MKKQLIILVTILSTITILFVGCTLETASPIDENAVASASATIDGVDYTFTNVELRTGSIFPQTGDSYTSNNVTMIADNGLKIEVKFSRENTGSKEITQINDSYAGAILTDTEGTEYNATGGTINVTDYRVDGLTKQTSGTFNFKGVYWINYSDSLVVNVTKGIFSSAKN
jgi:hypothetical protein